MSLPDDNKLYIEQTSSDDDANINSDELLAIQDENITYLQSNNPSVVPEKNVEHEWHNKFSSSIVDDEVYY